LELKLACPVCAEEHTYSVVVERSEVRGLVPGRKAPPQVKRQFVRLFNCPTTGNRYQAALQLSETAANRITAVTVRDAGEDAE
jgi:hypothetical protein